MLVLFIYIDKAEAQDLNKLNKSDLFKVSGAVNTTTTFYNVEGIDSRRDPLFWSINANLNFNVLGVAIPFSLNLTQQQRAFTQPFNQYGLSPEYKAYKLHLGYRSMNFSPYTLGGRVFFGVGFEYKPKDDWIQFGVLYGRFARAVQNGGNDGVIAGIPTYQRKGYGAKVRFGSDKSNISVIGFRGRDNEKSILDTGQLGDILPGENLVWSILAKHKFSKKLQVDIEYANSGYTRDVRNEQLVLEDFSYYNNLGGLFTPNATTQYNKAIITNLTYSQEKYNLKLSYKRIDPEYLSMGTPFLNNDIENVTAAVSWNMFQKKLNVTTTGGLQKNNLDEAKATRENRVVSGVNVTYKFKERLNLNLNYSNYTSTVNQIQIIQVDSIEFFQVTNNLSTRATYSLSKGKRRQNITAGSTIQKANDSYDTQTSMLNNNLGYQLSLTTIGLNAVVSLNYNNSIFTGVNSKQFGPTVSLSQSILKKKVSLRYTFNMLGIEANSVKQNRIINNRLAVRYSLKQKHSFSVNTTLLNRKSFIAGQDSFTETTVAFQYGYRF